VCFEGTLNSALPLLRRVLSFKFFIPLPVIFRFSVDSRIPLSSTMIISVLCSRQKPIFNVLQLECFVELFTASKIHNLTSR
jgi:hypothetical protein